jgi:hypothetical protein
MKAVPLYRHYGVPFPCNLCLSYFFLSVLRLDSSLLPLPAHVNMLYDTNEVLI